MTSLALFLLGPALYAAPATGPCASATANASVAAPSEPGKRMVVRGRVVQADGKTPAAGILMYVYQTDARGDYQPDSNGVPRLRAWLRTDAQGRYEYSTIRPGPYPNSRTPAHVHVQFWGEGVEPQWGRELLFEDDPYLDESARRQSRDLGEFAHVLRPQERNGTLLVKHDFKLKSSGDRLTGNSAHGYRACGGS